MNFTLIYFFSFRFLNSKYRSSFFGINLLNIFPLLSEIIFSNIYDQSFKNSLAAIHSQKK